MIRKLLIICLITVLLVSPVAAEQVTIQVDSKHIIGMGSGRISLDPENSINVVYLLSERKHGTYDNYILQEYPVSIQDYCKVRIGDTVTLEVPDSRLNVCKII